MADLGIAEIEVEVRGRYILSARDTNGSTWRAEVTRRERQTTRLLTHVLILGVTAAPFAVVAAAARPALPPAGERISAGSPVGIRAAQFRAGRDDPSTVTVAAAPPLPVDTPPPSPVPVATASALVLRCPVGHPLLVQGFGPTSLSFEPAFGGYRHFHTGLDFAAPRGTPVLASTGGTVASASYSSGGFGLLVQIVDGLGRRELYAHLERASVARGDKVAQGDTVGLVGSTGNSTGPHLHFELQVDGHPVAPSPEC